MNWVYLSREKPYHCGHVVMNWVYFSGEKPYQCGKCGKWFRSSSSLGLHRKRHDVEHIKQKQERKDKRRKETMEKIWQCTVCQRICPSNAHLIIHTRIHTGMYNHIIANTFVLCLGPSSKCVHFVHGCTNFLRTFCSLVLEKKR